MFLSFLISKSADLMIYSSKMKLYRTENLISNFKLNFPVD